MGPFAVSAAGVSVATASGPQSLLNIKNPMSKLDTTKIISFQTLSILFNNEPPQPVASPGFTDTQIYQFKHGYDYIPATWMTWQDPAPAYPANPPSGGTATTFFAFGDDTASSNIPGVGNTTQLSLYALVKYNRLGAIINNVGAFFYIKVDKTNVTLYLRKYIIFGRPDGVVTPLFIIGTTANMRIYVFAEPATTSTY